MKVPAGFKRCKCTGEDGRELGRSCGKLKRRDGSWNPAHGSWYGKADVPVPAGMPRARLQAGGFATRDEMTRWFEAAIALLAIPAEGPDGHRDRAEILALIRESRSQGAALPGLDDIRRRYSEGAAYKPGTTGEFLAAWLDRHRRNGDWSQSTLHSYEQTARRYFLPRWKDMPLDRLAAKHVWELMDAIDRESARITDARQSPDAGVHRSVAGRRPTSLATKKRILAVLRSALAEAASSGRDRPRLLAVNVAAGIKLGKDEGRRRDRRSKAALWTSGREAKWRRGFEERGGGTDGEGRFLEDANTRFLAWRSTAARPSNVMVWKPGHLGRFLDEPAVMGDRLYAMFCVIAYCGLRRGEACGLRWEDVDWDTASFAVGPTIVQAGWRAVEQDHAKAEASEDWVRLEKVVLDALRAWRQQQRAERLEWGQAWTDTGYVFSREDGTPYHPAHVTQRFERLAWGADPPLPPIRLHDLRHGAATLALAAGRPMKEVSSMLRHSSERITSQIYASVLPELKAEVSAAVASMVPRRAAVAD